MLFQSKKTKEKLILADKYINDKDYIEAGEKSQKELKKQPFRYDVINYIIETLNRETTYLEIGVRVPAHNFDKINATKKYSVDPGVEREHNPVDFPVTSDEFFNQLESGKILSPDIRFDIIFIDGLHLAEQVAKDIDNSLQYLKEDGYIVMHDCNSPTEFHARETFQHILSPAGGQWNGTTWKAFFQARMRNDISSCCIDTDWGVGIISKHKNLGEKPKKNNPFYEYYLMDEDRKDALNLISFEEFKTLIQTPLFICKKSLNV